MKPSERRALQAEKLAQKAAEERERAAEREARDREKRDGELSERERLIKAREERDKRDTVAPEDAGGISAEYTESKSGMDKPERGDGYHREGFFGSHVRLITFIITVTLILTVFGPWAIDRIVEKNRGDIVDTKKDITVTEVLALADRGNVKWEDLSAYNYTDLSYTRENKTYTVREYAIAGTGFVIKVGAYSDKGAPDYVRIIDYFNGEYVDISEGGYVVNEFISGSADGGKD